MLAQPAVTSRSCASTGQPETARDHGPANSDLSARCANRRRLCVDDGSDLAEVEVLLGRARGEQLHGSGDDAGPAGLVTRAEPRSVVAVEVLVEEDEISPVRILPELLGAAVHRPPALRVSQEDARESTGDFFGNLVQVHPSP